MVKARSPDSYGGYIRVDMCRFFGWSNVRCLGLQGDLRGLVSFRC